MTPSAPPCPRCFAPLVPSESPGGLCPKCMIAVAMGEDGMIRSAYGTPVPAPPSIDELGPHFPGLEIIALVGRGGSGAVYRTIQRDLGRVIALKVLLLDPAHDPAFGERFAREARAMALLNHPNIASVHDAGKAGPYWFLTMEFVDGANLRQVLRQGRMSAADALDFTRQICAALEYAHGMGVVHRDIKPENVLVDETGSVKLVDFGLAKLVGGAPDAVSLTGASQAMGTWRYMAPEQLNRPREVDHRADIFSLGVVLYELLTGEVPQGRYAPLSSRAKVDRRLDDVVDRTLEQDPDRRYQEARGVGEDLDSIGRGSRAPLHAVPESRAAAPEPAAEPAAGPAPKAEVRAQRGCLAQSVLLILWLFVGFVVLSLLTYLFFGAVSIEPMVSVGGQNSPQQTSQPAGDLSANLTSEHRRLAAQILYRISPATTPHVEVRAVVDLVAVDYAAALRSATAMTRVQAPERTWLQIDIAGFPETIAALEGDLLEAVETHHGAEMREAAARNLAAQPPFPFGLVTRSFEYEHEPERVLRELGGREFRTKTEIRDALPVGVRRRFLSRTLRTMTVDAGVAALTPAKGPRTVHFMGVAQASRTRMRDLIVQASGVHEGSPHWSRVYTWKPTMVQEQQLRVARAQSRQFGLGTAMTRWFVDGATAPLDPQFIPDPTVRAPFRLFLHADGKGVVVPLPQGEIIEDPNDRVELHASYKEWIELLSDN